MPWQEIRRVPIVAVAALFLLPIFSFKRNEAHARPSQPTSKSPDVRFTKADSRLLNDEEMATLRDSLRWEPDSVPVLPGGTAVSTLLDDQGRKLGAIRVHWTKTEGSKDAGPPVASFAVELENDSSCGFLAQAELDGPKGVVIVSSVDVDSWIGLHQPGPGETFRAEGDADLPSQNTKIELKPLAVSFALSACTTPKNPQDRGERDNGAK